MTLNKETTAATMGEILSETKELLAELEDGYIAPVGSITNSKGDYIDALKVQIASEHPIVISACSFFKRWFR